MAAAAAPCEGEGEGSLHFMRKGLILYEHFRVLLCFLYNYRDRGHGGGARRGPVTCELYYGFSLSSRSQRVSTRVQVSREETSQDDPHVGGNASNAAVRVTWCDMK